MLKVAVQAQIFLVAAVLLPESAWLADALRMKNTPQGHHMTFIIPWDEWGQLHNDRVRHQVLAFQVFLRHQICEHL